MKNLNKALLLTRLAITYQQQGCGDAFVNYYGHVFQICINLHDGPWDKNKEFTRLEIYLNGVLYDEEKYNKALNFLTACIEQKKLLNYENFL